MAASSVKFTLERTEDGAFLFADELVAAWGMGATFAESVEDWLIAANDLKAMLAAGQLHPRMQERLDLLTVALDAIADGRFVAADGA
jgi:hypothetical protein